MEPRGQRQEGIRRRLHWLPRNPKSAGRMGSLDAAGFKFLEVLRIVLKTVEGLGVHGNPLYAQQNTPARKAEYRLTVIRIPIFYERQFLIQRPTKGVIVAPQCV